MKTVRRKHDLDALVAAELGLSQKQVRDVTTNFIAKLLDCLADFEDVHVDNFGRFRLVTEKGLKTTLVTSNLPGKVKKPQVIHVTRKFRVSFSKSEVFNRILREKHGPNVKEK